jgi:hypothetical protein
MLGILKSLSDDIDATGKFIHNRSKNEIKDAINEAKEKFNRNSKWEECISIKNGMVARKSGTYKNNIDMYKLGDYIGTYENELPINSLFASHFLHGWDDPNELYIKELQENLIQLIKKVNEQNMWIQELGRQMDNKNHLIKEQTETNSLQWETMSKTIYQNRTMQETIYDLNRRLLNE